MLPPSCTLHYRPDLHLLVARWPGDASLQQLQADFEAVLEAAQQYNTSRWLLDVRRRNELTPGFTHWVAYEFLFRAATQLAPLLVRVAALSSPARLTTYQSEEQVRAQADLAYGLAGARPYRLALFTDEGAAMQWLQI